MGEGTNPQALTPPVSTLDLNELCLLIDNLETRYTQAYNNTYKVYKITSSVWEIFVDSKGKRSELLEGSKKSSR